jgi:hypothetical protein
VRREPNCKKVINKAADRDVEIHVRFEDNKDNSQAFFSK